MIANYEHPQTTIAQELENTANVTLDRLHAVVVGPAFVHADARADNLVWESYLAAAPLTYRRKVAGVTTGLATETLDPASVSLHARNLRLALFSRGLGTSAPLSGSGQFRTYIADPTGDLIFYTANAGIVDSENPAAVTAFDDGRAPIPGDIYRITSTTGTVERRVVGLVGKDTSAVKSGVSYAGALGQEPLTPLVVTYANFTEPSPAAFVEAGPVSTLFTHQSGRVAPASSAGLRLNLEVTCITAGDRDTAVFSATANGVPVTVDSASGIAANSTVFNLITDLALTLTRSGTAWAVGDRFSATVDLETAGEVLALDEVDFSAYTVTAGIRKIPSTLILEVLAVTSGSTTLRLSDSAGLMTPVVHTAEPAGPELEFAYDGIVASLTVEPELIYAAGNTPHVGQRYTLRLTPPSRSTTRFDKVRLSGPLGMQNAGANLKVEAFTLYTGGVPATEPQLGGSNYVVTSSAATIGTLTLPVAGYALPSDAVKTAVNGVGELALAFRAVKLASGKLEAIDTEDEILAAVGSVALESELGYGALRALRGAQFKRVYLLNTGALDADDAAWTAALKAVEAFSASYAIALLTERETPMQALAAHCRRLSAPGVKRFRRGYVGTDSPGEYPVLAARADGSTYSATISLGSNGLYNLVTFVDADLNLETIFMQRGDLFRINGASFAIEEVTGPDTLLLQVGAVAAVAAAPATVVAADTPENTGRYVWKRSERLGNGVEEDRRIANLWTDHGVLDTGDGSPRVIPNRFGACEAAGLRTALQPQQGLTRTEMTYITDAPSMYTRFTPAVLNEMAANGVWIVTQNSADSAPYVRHQLTTAVSSGSLFYEDSAGTNIDAVCFLLDDIIDPLIGKRNATPRTVAEIKNLLIDALNDLTESAYDSQLGPQLAGFYNTAGEAGTLDVSINPTFKDRVDIRVVLEIPLPLNNIRVVVLARTIRADGGTTVNLVSSSILN